MALGGIRGKAVSMVSGDSLTGRQRVQAMYATGAVTVVSQTATIWNPGAAAFIDFPVEAIQFDGLSVSAGAGTLFVYLA